MRCMVPLQIWFNVMFVSFWFVRLSCCDLGLCTEGEVYGGGRYSTLSLFAGSVSTSQSQSQSQYIFSIVNEIQIIPSFLYVFHIS